MNRLAPFTTIQIFLGFRLQASVQSMKWRYPLTPLSVLILFLFPGRVHRIIFFSRDLISHILYNTVSGCFSCLLVNSCWHMHACSKNQEFVCFTVGSKCFQCLSNAMHSTGQDIKSRKRPSVRRLWTRLWRHLWTGLHQIRNIAFPCHTEEHIFEAVRSEVVCAHARPLMDCHLQVFNVWGFISP